MKYQGIALWLILKRPGENSVILLGQYNSGREGQESSD
jgi:hypothetical protein